jgi:hypothetical protein
LSDLSTNNSIDVCRCQDDPYDRESVRNGYFHTSTYGGLGGGSLYTLSVNPYSGGYNLHLPVLELPGRAGHDLRLSLTFNSKQFYLLETWISTWYGYRYGFGPESYLPGPHQGRWLLNVWPSLKEEVAGSLYRFTTPDGAVHKLDQPAAGGWLRSRDGSDLAYHPERPCHEPVQL